MNCQLLSVYLASASAFSLGEVYLASAFQQQFLTFTLWAVTHAGHAKHSEQVLLGLDGDRSSDTSNNLFRHTLADVLAFRARLACGLDGSMYCVNSQVLRMGAFSLSPALYNEFYIHPEPCGPTSAC